jgi:hypothetical protein
MGKYHFFYSIEIRYGDIDALLKTDPIRERH